VRESRSVKLWQRRAVRQMIYSVLPLVIICIGVIVILGARANSVARELTPATATAVGTVAKDGTGSDGLDITWKDAGGQQHTSHLAFPDVGAVAKGRQVGISYVPGDPSRAYAVGDTLDSRGREAASGVLFAILVLFVGVAVTGFRLWRRAAAQRRPAQTYPVRWAQYRRGLIRRSYLVVDANKHEWWIPVYWQPGLAAILAGTPAKVHGNPVLDRLLVVDVNDTTVWPSARRKPGKPRGKGEWIEGSLKYSKTAVKQREREGGPDIETVSMPKQLAGDISFVLLAPILGLLWAYVDRSGVAGFVVATVLVASVLFWLPGVFGSDPT
jgi:hypothetical protein